MAQPQPTAIDKKTLKTKRQMLTTAEASEYLGVNEGTLRNWRSERRGPPFVTLAPRVIRYRLDALHAWLDDVSTDFQRTGA